MTLAQAQRLFVRLVGQLLVWAYQQPGIELTFGEAWRTPEQAAWNAAHGTGIKNSLHVDRLAVDLNLWVDGVYKTDSADYTVLGDYWKTLNPLCRWGGDFKDHDGIPTPDADHFSLTFGGRS